VEKIAEQSSRPQLFQVSRTEMFRLILGSLVFALVFLCPVFSGSYVVVNTPEHHMSEVKNMGSGLGEWLDSWPNLDHLKVVPAQGDRDLFSELRWVPYYTISHFNQFPFWDPYRCGGMPMLGNPEAGVFSPYVALYLGFGLIPGMLLEIYFHLAIAFAGGYLLGREFGLPPLVAAVLGAMFPSSSWLALHVAAGHLNFLSFAYMPLIIAMLMAACRMRRWYPAAFGGLLWALTLTEGNYAFVYTGVLIAIVVATLAAIRLSVRPLVAAVVMGVFACGFSALKLIPCAELPRLYPRDSGASWVTWGNELVSIFSRNQDFFRPMTGPFLFCEYGGYIGWPFAILAVLGIIGGGLDMLPWLVGAIFFFLVYRGDNLPYAPSHFWRYLPLGGNMNSISGRWGIPMVFCVGVLAALGAQVLHKLAGRWGPRLTALLLIVGLIDAWIVCAPNYRYLFRTDIIPPPPSESFRQYYMEHPTSMYPLAAANMGSARCWSYGYNQYTYDHQRGAALGYNEAGYRGEYYLLDAGKVTQTEWTPNRLSFEIDTPAATSLVINQNTYPGWRVAQGTGSIYSYDGRIAVRVPAGRQQIQVLYLPRHIIWAYIITSLAAVTLIMVWLLETRRLIYPRQTAQE